MRKDFEQVSWDDTVIRECETLIQLAVQEDRTAGTDLTSEALVPADATGSAAVVARRPGVVAGLKCAELIFAAVDPQISWTTCVDDGSLVTPGLAVAAMRGPARSMLTAERLMLNFLCRLSGISTQTRKFVDLVAGTNAQIYDTRKTTPGWRQLEKYAVRQGGGRNHRLGLSQAILIKDNHLAVGASGTARYSPAQAVHIARQYLEQSGHPEAIVEIEVDTLEQLALVLPAQPDIVLLDNMTPEVLAKAVQMRDNGFQEVQLEASGTVNLDTVRKIAESGVERISAGAITHSASWLDFGLDWTY